MAHGPRPTIRNCVQTDVMTPGSVQRQHLEVLELELVELVEFSAANLFEDKGKLAVVVQHAYHMAAPHCQRMFRGWQGRNRAHSQAQYFRFVAMTAAVSY